MVAEQARFLLRELQALLISDGLVDSDDVVIVAARFAYPEYLQRGAYICQSGRAFRDGLTHMGFYAEGAIQAYIPRIRHRETPVFFTYEEANKRRTGSELDRLIADLIEADLYNNIREAGEPYQVFLLSGPNDLDTVRLASNIVNDTRTESGRSWAWTLGQRYVSLAGLTHPYTKSTSDLKAR